MSSHFLNALAGTRLYPLTDRQLSGLSHAEQVFQLCEGGATVIQLREKLLSPLEFYNEVRVAAQMPVDYVAIGPIFATVSKQSSNTLVGLEGLRRVRQSLGSLPLVAIGGITLQNSFDVLTAGCDAVSLIRDIWIHLTLSD